MCYYFSILYLIENHVKLLFKSKQSYFTFIQSCIVYIILFDLLVKIIALDNSYKIARKTMVLTKTKKRNTKNYSRYSVRIKNNTEIKRNI